MRNLFYKSCYIYMIGMAVSQHSIAQRAIAPPPPPQGSGEKSINIQRTDQAEIIIRQKGDKDSKITVEIKNGEYFINGKPLEKFDDQNFEVEKRDIGDEVIELPPTAMSPFRERELEGAVRAYSNEAMAKKMQKAMKIRMNSAFLGVSSHKSDKGGATVLEVTKESPADKAGLKKGDIITMINDVKIENPDGLFETIHNFKPGDKVKVTFLREGKAQTVIATLDKSSQNFNYNYNYDFKMPPMPEMKGFNQDFWGNRQPKLGITAQDSEDGKGVNVIDVEDSSAAAKAGILKGDLILQFDGADVGDVNELIGQTEAARQKAIIKVKVQRNGKTMDLDLKIPKNLKKAEL